MTLPLSRPPWRYPMNPDDTSRARPMTGQQPDSSTKARRIWRSWLRQGNAIFQLPEDDWGIEMDSALAKATFVDFVIVVVFVLLSFWYLLANWFVPRGNMLCRHTVINMTSDMQQSLKTRPFWPCYCDRQHIQEVITFVDFRRSCYRFFLLSFCELTAHVCDFGPRSI